jgi:aspartyl protease family protein
MRCIASALACAALAAAASAAAEVYSWTDESGRTHFTQDLSRVPPQHRAAARERAAAPADDSRIQTFASPPARRGGGASGASASPGGGFSVRVERAGTGMFVVARLNESVNARFLLDTGASDVVIPKAVADQLGLDTGPGARTKLHATANGVVQQPVVMLDSVKLGGAEARQVPATVSASMTDGLLGLSFFNRFTYSVDAAAGIVTLQPNQLDQTGDIRGGRSEAQWRAEYANLQGRLAAVERERDRTPPHHTRELRRLAELHDEYQRQLQLLDGEADHARVPFPWRR